MCYNAPGPRCSGHTRTKYIETKAALEAAEKDVKEKKAVLNAAATAEAKAELQNSEKMLAAAKKAHKVADENYAESKAKRAEAMVALREAKKEYLTSPEGIQTLRDQGKNAEADRFQKRREAQKAALKAKEAADDNKVEVASSEPASVASVEDAPAVTEAPAAETEWTEEKIAKRLAVFPSDIQKRAFLTRAGCPTEILIQLAKSDDRLIRSSVAENSTWRASPELLKELATDNDRYVREAVAGNWRTPPETLRSLVNDDDKTVRLAAAGNKSLPPEVLARFINSEDRAMKEAAVRNPSMDFGVVENFANSDDMNMRKIAAGSPQITADMARKFLDDSDYNVRSQVLDNKKIPVVVLKEFIKGDIGQKGIVWNEPVLHGRVSPVVGKKAKDGHDFLLQGAKDALREIRARS